MRDSELIKRTKTGVIGAAILLFLVTIGGKVGTALLAVAISLGMLYEFVEIVFSLPDKSEKRFVLLGTAWLIAFFNFWLPRSEWPLFLLTFTGLFAYFMFSSPRHKGPDFGTHFRELMFSVFGVLYVVFLPLFLPLIREQASGAAWVVLFLLINWMGDTGAYFVGKKYGRRKLFPSISPKKTVEGSLGGLGAGIVFTLIFKLLIFKNVGWAAVLVVPVLVGSVAQFGDLCESFFKRAYDKKDSGSVIPGHGGFLDRFDGVVISLPIMYACVRIFS